MMKRCPYCAEEIQDKASYCRYCHNKLRGRWVKYVFLAVIVSALAALIFTYRSEIKTAIGTTTQFLTDVRDGFVSMKNASNDWKKIKEAQKEYDRAIEAIDKVMKTR